MWDDDERAAYDEALAEVRALASTRGHERRWFLSWNHQVFGPTRLTEVSGVEDSVSLLVCFDASSGWVDLSDVHTAPQTTSHLPNPDAPEANPAPSPR